MPVRARNRPVPVVGSSSGWPTSQRSPASAAGTISRAPASGWPGAAATTRRQRRNGAEAIRAIRSGPGCGPSATSARRCSSRSPNASPATASTETSRPSSRAVNASMNGATWSATAARRDDLHVLRRARRLVYRAPRQLGEAEDLAGQRGEPAAAGRERDAAAVADEELVAELPAQRPDRDGDGRLGHLELRRRLLPLAVARDEHERLQLSEGHAADPS